MQILWVAIIKLAMGRWRFLTPSGTDILVISDDFRLVTFETNKTLLTMSGNQLHVKSITTTLEYKA